jgi:hypothetical protein
MRKLVLLSLMFGLNNVYALDFKSIKESLRPFSSKYLGSKVTNKYFGNKDDGVKLPLIPALRTDSKSTYSLSKKSILATQGQEYNILTIEKKRPYRVAFLEELFEATRKQKIEDDALLTWLNTMEQGSSREGVYRALVLDRVYSSLENFQDAPTQEAVKITSDLYKKFINRPVSVSALQNLNIYSIKKIITGKCLDVIEAFETNPEGMYKWYAVLSRDLAKIFSYNNKLRDDQRSKIHYDWAKSVPYQHIKSEVIIKIHLGFNKYLK